MALSVFTTLSHLVKVRDLMSPLRSSLSMRMTIADALVSLSHDETADNTRLSLVVDDDGRLVGATDHAMLWDAADSARLLYPGIDGKPSGLTLAELEAWQRAIIATPVRPETIVAHDTPAWSALTMLVNYHDLYVVEETSIVGTVRYEDLFKPIFRACLFALVNEVEQQLSRHCLVDAAASWDSLDEKQRNNIRRTFFLARPNTWRWKWPDGPAVFCRTIDEEITQRSKERNISEQQQLEEIRDAAIQVSKLPEALLEYSTLGQKRTIILRRGLLPQIEATELQLKLRRVERVRNFCAHPHSTDETVFDRKDLDDAIRDCHRLINLSRSEEQID